MAIYKVTVKVIPPKDYKTKTLKGIVFGKTKKNKEDIKNRTLAFLEGNTVETTENIKVSFKIMKMELLKEDFMFNYD